MARLHLVLAFASFLTATGCFNYAISSYYEDPRRFSPRPDETYSIEPVAKVNETLFGFHLFGMRVKSIDPLKLRDEYLTHPNYRITNWQLLIATVELPYLAYLCTIPYAKVVFDVVEVD
jgi:hypothetical protein